MIALTGEPHQAIEDAGGEPVRVEAPETKAAYLLLRAEVDERVRALLGVDGLSPEEAAPLIWGVDPAMDAYDRHAAPGIGHVQG